MGHPVGDVHCSIADCDASIKNHYWGHVQAEGWFFQKDGTAFCPEHVPDWVEAWRASKRNT